MNGTGDKDARARERLILTRDAAAALLEDVSYIRRLLGEAAPPSPEELRRLSAVLRRILIDSDLSNVAAPRMGSVKLWTPDTKPFMKFSRRFPLFFFASGGAKLFGWTISAATVIAEQPDDATVAQLSGVLLERKTVELRLETFLTQPVLCLEGTWINRRDVVKYIAICAHGVHSKTPQEQEHSYKALARIRRGVRYSVEKGIHIELDRLGVTEPSFRYDPKALDLVLVELLVAAKYLVEAPDTQRLEGLIHEEFSTLS
jgi:hypothetical protein